MPRLVLLAALGAAAASCLVIVGTAGANNGAVIVNDEYCNMIDGDGNPAFATSSHRVVNHSGGLLTCSVKGVPNSTGKAINYDTLNNPWLVGLQCGNSVLGLTDEWTETISASGNATLRCHFNGPDA